MQIFMRFLFTYYRNIEITNHMSDYRITYFSSIFPWDFLGFRKFHLFVYISRPKNNFYIFHKQHSIMFLIYFIEYYLSTTNN